MRLLYGMPPCAWAPTGPKCMGLQTDEVLRLERQWQRAQKAGRTLADMLLMAGPPYVQALANRAYEANKNLQTDFPILAETEEVT